MLRMRLSLLTRSFLVLVVSGLAACAPNDVANTSEAYSFDDYPMPATLASREGYPMSTPLQPLGGYPVHATVPPTDPAYGSADALTQIAGLARPGPFPTFSPGDREVFSAVVPGSIPERAIAEVSISAESYTKAGVNTERLTLTYGDHQYVLGAENGTAKWGAVGEHSFAWFLLCRPCVGLDPGLYVLDLRTGEQRWIAAHTEDVLGSVIVAEPWVLYYTSGNARYHMVLHAFNLDTAKDMVLDVDATYPMAGPRDVFALNEGAAAWLSIDPNDSGVALKWIDLDTGETRTVIDETIAEASGLSVSKSLVVWAVDYWKVYDCRTETIHPLPRLPENVNRETVTLEKTTAPTAHGNEVYWSVTIDGVQQDLMVRVGK